MYAVTRRFAPVNPGDSGATQTIFTCMRHIPQTMTELKSETCEIQDLGNTGGLHDCMGCLKNWDTV